MPTETPSRCLALPPPPVSRPPLARLMRVSGFVLGFFAAGAAARATLFVIGDGIALSPGFSRTDPAVIGERGVLNLLGPGTYTAESWIISGELRLSIPGTYILVATSGSIAVNGTASIRGPNNASRVVANLSFAHAGELIFTTPRVEPTVTIVRGAAVPLESPPLVNISTRVTLAPEQVSTAGFVVGGRTSRRVLVRAVGPSLASFGVTNALVTPVLTVLNAQGVVGTNAGWGGGPELAFSFTRVGAFPLPPTSRDAALILALEPGSYTAQVSGGVGEVLLEIYHVD